MIRSQPCFIPKLAFSIFTPRLLSITPREKSHDCLDLVPLKIHDLEHPWSHHDHALPNFRYSDSTFNFTYIGGPKRWRPPGLMQYQSMRALQRSLSQQ
uniref:Uncharacterized protein n=1 Tax=Phocoena sinus TaxID=42100 RepID=A0A8C9BB36_PHOSS